ncbi:uncharacterized protein F5891DRAFT_898267, partial [Suillus fuscotomentosus]
LQTIFGAIDFIPALQTFLNHHFPCSSVSASNYDWFDVFKSILLILPKNSHVSDLKWLNHLQAHPPIPNHEHCKPAAPAHFDVAFVVKDCDAWKSGTGLDGLQVAQIHVIFKLPSHYGNFTHPLTYIKWFCPLHDPEPTTNLYQLVRSTHNQQCFASVVSMQDVLQA